MNNPESMAAMITLVHSVRWWSEDRGQGSDDRGRQLDVGGLRSDFRFELKRHDGEMAVGNFNKRNEQAAAIPCIARLAHKIQTIFSRRSASQDKPEGYLQLTVLSIMGEELKTNPNALNDRFSVIKRQFSAVGAAKWSSRHRGKQVDDSPPRRQGRPGSKAEPRMNHKDTKVKRINS